MRTYGHRNLLPPLAVVDGVRTPFAKAFTALSMVPADQLGRSALLGLLERVNLPRTAGVDEVVFGNVSGPPESSNVARVIALKAGLPQSTPAHTVNRNCAAGMEAIFSAWQIIGEGRGEIVVAGGVESMSNVPLLWHHDMRDWLLAFRKASVVGRARLLTKLRPRMLKPIAGLELGLTDPTCGLNMGQTAEVLAQRFSISREAQDQFALRSHQLATAAWDRGFYRSEVAGISNPLIPSGSLQKDVGPRANQSLEALAKLKPIFDRKHGTVTAGNSCSITDGAVALLLMSADKARELQLQPLGYIRGYAVAGCDPRQMGLGPVFAMHRLLQETGKSLSDFELFEINEAFAAQVLACLAACSSQSFAQQELGSSKVMGEINPALLNVNGGAIALGHPVGASGTRLVLTLLRALRDRGLRRGLASLCVGGGQGAAVWVERELEN